MTSTSGQIGCPPGTGCCESSHRPSSDSPFRSADDGPGAQLQRPEVDRDAHGGSDELAFAVKQRSGKVEHLVEDGVIGSALEDLGHLQGYGLHEAAEHSQCERVLANLWRGHNHASPQFACPPPAGVASSMIKVPYLSTSAVSPAGAVVVSICSMIAGPTMRLLAFSRVRSYVLQSMYSPASSKKTFRGPLERSARVPCPGLDLARLRSLGAGPAVAVTGHELDFRLPRGVPEQVLVLLVEEIDKRRQRLGIDVLHKFGGYFTGTS